MVSKGIITSIDYTGNTCEVRIPVFESAASKTEVCLPARISMTPGLYNNYKEGDVVYVTFEDNQIENPIVIGKLYLGAATEGKDPRGALNCDTISSTAPISIPIDTKLTLNNNANNLTTVGVENDLSSYKTIADIARNIQKQETQIGSINAQFIDDGSSFAARVARLEEDDTRHEAELQIHADEIEARVRKEYNDGKQQGLGWDLNEESWKINAYDTVLGHPDLKELNIVTIDRKGMTINGDLKINGYPSEIITKYTQWADPDHYPACYIDVGTKSSLDDYINLYVLKSGDYVLVAEYNKDKLGITINETVAYDINTTDWIDTEPARVDGLYIWQWTRTFKYDWIDTGNLETSYWVYSYTDEIVCLTGATGQSAVSYWLNFETPIHSGKNQDTNITITAYKKIGTSGVDEGDTNAYIRYYFEGDTIPAWPGSPNSPVTIQAIVSNIHQFKDADLIIEATHNPNETPAVKVYEKETITYAPLDKPILDLTSDNASIAYDGNTKLGNDVSSTAQVYLGTNVAAATYSWTLVGCTGTGDTTATITVNSLTADNATATCTATCTNLLDENGNAVVLTKVFTITKQLKGIQGETGTSVSECKTYYALSNTASPTGPATGDSNIAENTINKWWVSPMAFDKNLYTGYEYWAVERRVYIDPSSVVWGTPTKASMLSIDFIDSLGITAKKITVLNDNTAEESTTNPILFEADGLSGTGAVQIAGWEATNNKLTSGQGSGAISIQSDTDTEFIAADYIIATGAQYIDSGLILDLNTSTIEITAQATTSEQNGMVFGVWDTTHQAQSALYHYRDEHAVTLYLYSNDTQEQVGIATSLSNTDLAKHTYKIYQKKLYVDNVEKSSLPNSVGVSTYNTFIGAGNNTTSGGSWFYQGKIYSCKIYNNGNLVRNYIPVCKHGVFGLYDLVNKEFKPSATDTPFDGVIAENLLPVIEKNGIKYQRLEYIQNNGTNNYIDLDWVPDFDTGFEVTAIYSPTASTDAGNSRGGLLSNYDTTTNLSLEITTGARFYANNSDLSTMPGLLINAKNTSIFLFKNNTWINTLNGVTETGTATITGQSGSGVRLFCDKYNGGRFTTFTVPVKIYSIVIRESGNIVHNYLPVKCASGTDINKVGVLDLVTGNFFAGQGDPLTYSTTDIQGGDTFIVEGHSYRVLKYIESDGTAYIDTGYNSSNAYQIDCDMELTGAVKNDYWFGQQQQADVVETGHWQYNGIYGNSNLEFNWQNIPFIAANRIKMTQALRGSNVDITINNETFTKPVGSNGYIANFLIFACYDTTGALRLYASPFRLYSFKIHEGSTIVHNFIPVLKDEHEYGLWDTISNAFFGNANSSGTFTGEAYPYEFDSIYLGSEESTSAPFRVTNTGKLFASEANITGTVNATDGNFTGNINATSGNIGGFEIQGNSLFADGENGSVSLSADGITVGDIFNINPDGSASFKGNLAANSLLIGDVNDITKQLPLWASDVSNTSAVEYFNIDEYEYSSTGTFWQPWKVKFTVSSYSDREHTIPVSVASNRTITATLKFEYTTPMGGTRFTTRTEIIVLTPSSSGGSTYESDWKEYDLGVYWVTGFTISIEPQEYNANKGNFKNINGFFVDKYGCCTKQFLFDFKNINVDTGLPRNTSFNLRGYTGTGTDSYKTCFFNLSYFLNNNDYTKFQRVYGFNLQLISRHTNNSGYAVDANTADSVSEIHAWAERGSIAVFCGVDALSSDSLGIGYFVPNDTSSIFATNVVVAGWGAELYNGHGREVDFKEHYDRANSMFTGLVLTVYGVPK